MIAWPREMVITWSEARVFQVEADRSGRVRELVQYLLARSMHYGQSRIIIIIYAQGTETQGEENPDE